MKTHFPNLAGAASLLLLFSACGQKPIVYTTPDSYPVYTGNDLELTYTPSESKFRLWSPGADAAEVRLYVSATDTLAAETLSMSPSDSGTWTATARGDKKGMFYTFRIRHNGNWMDETPGIWAKATGTNGKRAAIVNLSETNPEGWNTDQAPPQKSFADMVIYELHVRDISINPNSGIAHAGKFLGLAEENTHSPDGLTTGLAHLRELGITHVHLLPVFDFHSIDESIPENDQYNWGYDPQNYNVPEGSYSTNPADPATRIREFKQMVMALHRNGIRVIMDVVYNHTGGANEQSNFHLTAPGYFYRMNPDSTWSNASGCGNETASDRPMMRRYIAESVKYWATEYHIDGFRFDLMGIHDVETMNLVRTELDAISPQIFVYGEGWLAGVSPLPEEQRATKANVQKMPRIAVFSDEIRDAVKGPWNDNHATAFASGRPGLEESIKFGIVGAIAHPGINFQQVNYTQTPWATEPLQCITYVSCHDNHALFDKFAHTCPDATPTEIRDMNKLANAIVLTSQGVPFLHNGVEMLRTKQGVENSYQSPDSINQIDWHWKQQNADVVAYHQGLIALRKAHPLFRLGSAAEVQKRLTFLPTGHCLVGFTLDGTGSADTWQEAFVAFNGNRIAKSLPLPQGQWKVYADGNGVYPEGKPLQQNGEVTLPAVSALILGR